MATTEETPLLSTTIGPLTVKEWPLAVRLVIPIVSVVTFIIVQVLVLFIRDPGYKNRNAFIEDGEFQNPSPTAEGPATEEKKVMVTSLQKSSSTSCHIQSREENRKGRQSRRTMSESAVLPSHSDSPQLTETQAYLQGVLRCPFRLRFHSISSTSATSEDGGSHVPTFGLTFSKKRRTRSQSTGEVGSNSPGLLENYRMTSGGNLDANQMTISSIQEENEFGSRDPYYEEERRQIKQLKNRNDETEF